MRLISCGVLVLVVSVIAVPSALGEPVSRSKFTYQGQLTLDGQKINQPCDFDFCLFDDPVGGNEIGCITEPALPVEDGVFTVMLDFGMAAMRIDPLWLEIKADCTGATDTLRPRQQLTGSPFAIRAFGMVPIGSIQAWHKDLFDTPVLPDGWLECNGQEVDDSESPFHGKTLPNLNGEARFLRGGADSGLFESDAIRSHNHTIDHDHGAVDTGNNNVGHTHAMAHTHAIDPPNTASGANNKDHTHSHNHGPVQTSGAGNAASVQNLPNVYNMTAVMNGFIGKTWQSADAHKHTVDLPNKVSSTQSTNHSHSVNIAPFTSGASSAGSTGDVSANHHHTVDLPNYTGVSGSCGGTETRPVNMSVVWIIRVK